MTPLAALVKQFPNAEFNIEGNPHHNLMPLLLTHRPQQGTFVPDAQGQATSDHGFAAGAPMDAVRPMIAQAKARGMRVSIFVDAEMAAIDAVKAAGADRIELYTEPYAEAFARGDYATVLAQFAAAAAHARKIGLGVNAGHDLNTQNLPAFIAAVNPDEVSIGHAVIADAVIHGLANTIKTYRAICNQ
jgi:pyridoxine 5-phosphate synthase